MTPSDPPDQGPTGSEPSVGEPADRAPSVKEGSSSEPTLTPHQPHPGGEPGFSLPGFSVHNPILVNLLMLTILIGGCSSP